MLHFPHVLLTQRDKSDAWSPLLGCSSVALQGHYLGLVAEWEVREQMGVETASAATQDVHTFS